MIHMIIIFTKINQAGWHCSWCFTPEGIRKKLLDAPRWFYILVLVIILILVMIIIPHPHPHRRHHPQPRPDLHNHPLHHPHPHPQPLSHPYIQGLTSLGTATIQERRDPTISQGWFVLCKLKHARFVRLVRFSFFYHYQE